MKLIREFIPVFFGCIIFGSSSAQEFETTEALRAKVYELLSYQCGAADVENDFINRIDAIGVPARPLLLEILSEGAPAEILNETQEHAEERYRRRQRWLSENGSSIFGDNTAGVDDRDQSQYVESYLRKVNILYTENAIRGLGIIGDEDSIPLLQRLGENNPNLRLIIENAVRLISDR